MSFFWAFVIGGAICTLGHFLILRTNITPTRILVLFVSVGVLLGALQIFAPIRDFAGAGITVPIIGFGGTMVEGVIKAVEYYGLIGVFMGGFAAAAAGLAVAVTFALLMSLIFKSRAKT